MMREKIIFDGVIEADRERIIKELNFFYFLNNIFDFEIQRKYYDNGSKIIEKIILEDGKTEIVNGYFNINQNKQEQKSIVNLKIVSCREELDIIYFQLSQHLQAKFVLPDYPPMLLTIPLKDLYAEGMISKNDMLPNLNKLPGPNDIPKFGTNRDLSFNDVRRHIIICRKYMSKGGTAKEYYELYMTNYCDYETFKKYLKDKRFKQ